MSIDRSNYISGANESHQNDSLLKQYGTLNAPVSKIRNRLLRLSVDLLVMMKV